MMKKRFNLITRTDEPYCVDVAHGRKEFAFRNRNYARLGSAGDTYFLVFPPETDVHTIWFYSDSTQPDNSRDRRRYEQRLSDTMDSLREYKEV